jgi:Amt family ammonium transporter
MGCLGSLAVSWLKFGKPDISMTFNGVLAGLVAITAPCATITPLGSVMVGFLAGILVVFAVLFFDKIRVDDPVGAISVHGVCGSFGTLCAALFHENLFLGKEYDLVTQFTTQLLGVGVTFLWTFGTAWLLFKAIAATVGLRVTAEEEMGGLDLHEHGAEAYPDFTLGSLTAAPSAPHASLGPPLPMRDSVAKADPAQA